MPSLPDHLKNSKVFQPRPSETSIESSLKKLFEEYPDLPNIMNEPGFYNDLKDQTGVDYLQQESSIKIELIPGLVEIIEAIRQRTPPSKYSSLAMKLVRKYASRIPTYSMDPFDIWTI